MAVTIADLERKIQTNNDAVAKLNALIGRKNAAIEKHRVSLADAENENDAYWVQCKIDDLNDEIRHTQYKIDSKTESTEKLLKKIEKLKETEAHIEEMYAHCKEFADRTVEKWDFHDKGLREVSKLNAEARIPLFREESELHSANISALESLCDTDRTAFTEALKKENSRHRYAGADIESEYPRYRQEHMSDEEIHTENVEAIRALLNRMYDSVHAYVGNILDLSYLHVDTDNQGFAVINGKVHGEKGWVRVQSVLAGGYNIQRLHVRLLVNRLKGE